MQNGENIQALHKNLELIRFVSIFLLLIHFYSVCYPAFQEWGLTVNFISNLIFRLSKGLSFLSGFIVPKLSVLFLLGISLFGEKGRKDTKLTLRPILITLAAGLLLYFLSSFILESVEREKVKAIWYISITSVGYLLILFGSARLSRLLTVKLGKDIFNIEAETFPQEERLLENEYSINLPAQYRFKGKLRKSFINIISPARALLCLGVPGSGKSFFVIRHVITQHIQKGFTFFLYDFKYPDLTLIAYNTALKNIDKYAIPPKFYTINFDDLSRTHRCNLLAPETMHDITDASESSRTIMLALNRQWITKNGDFFVESPINFTTAIFWYLKKYKNGIFCTLPHAIELCQIEYDKLFPVLSLEPELEVLIG